jgi:hypothetical protein
MSAMSIESEANAYLDQAVLQIMLDNEGQRPISEAEVARIVSTPGYVPASLKRLRVAGLIHRWNDLATATHAAVYYHEITQHTDPDSRYAHVWDSAVLESLIVRGNDGQGPLTVEQFWHAFGAKKKHKNSNREFQIRGVQQSPKLYPEPHRFQPERFLERSAPYTFIPFGGGDRRCIGASFAMMEIKSVLCTVLERVELRITNSRDERSNRLRSIAIVPAREVRVLAAARHSD